MRDNIQERKLVQHLSTIKEEEESTSLSTTNSDCDEPISEDEADDDCSTLSENDQVRILCEIVAAFKLNISNTSLSPMDVRPYAVVEFGRPIHRTKESIEPGRNPFWSLSSRSLFILTATPRELAHQDLEISLWTKRKDTLLLTTLETYLLGKVVIPGHDILSHCTEQRIDLPILLDDSIDLDNKNAKPRGSLSLRFRLATESDDQLVELFLKAPKLNRQLSQRNLFGKNIPTSSIENQGIDRIKEKPIATIVTELDEAKVAGEHFVNAISTAFTTNSYYDRNIGQHKIRVKPYPDPDRVEETTYLTEEDLLQETLAPSKKWVQAGSGALGKLYLEVLRCHNLPNVDVGEAIGNVTDTFICAIFEDAMVQTPVIDDELSPHWPCWTQRAFCFGIMHPASMLFIGCFDYDLGLTDHEPLGRVAVNISNLQRSTDYTLDYNLYTSSELVERTAAGSITIRLRVEYYDEKQAIMTALRPRPKFHVNVKKEKTLKVVNFTCLGTNNQNFDMALIRSYVNELLEYKQELVYSISDAALSLIFWRGQVRVFDHMLPLHSFVLFLIGTTLVERPQLFPSLVLLSFGWILVANQRLRQQHPSPWHRCPSFWHYVDILRNERSTLSINRIDAFEGAKETEEYEQARKQRIENDQETAARKAEYRAKLSSIGDETIETKLAAGGIPLEWLDRLARYQAIIGQYCRYCRFAKIIITWEESIVSFWVTAILLGTGMVSLLLPWSFILTWLGRMIVWGLLGPHMKLVDLYHKSISKDEKLFNKMMDKFREESRSARIRRQEAMKLKDIKCKSFGEYITLVPNFNLSRLYDRPLPSSYALVHPENAPPVEFGKEHIPGQQFFGVMVPRTQEDHLKFNKELPNLQELLLAVQERVAAIQETENVHLLKRLLKISRGQAERDMPASIGYELVHLERQSTSPPENEHPMVSYLSNDSDEALRTPNDWNSSNVLVSSLSRATPVPREQSTPLETRLMILQTEEVKVRRRSTQLQMFVDVLNIIESENKDEQDDEGIEIVLVQEECTDGVTSEKSETPQPRNEDTHVVFYKS